MLSTGGGGARDYITNDSSLYPRRTRGRPLSSTPAGCLVCVRLPDTPCYMSITRNKSDGIINHTCPLNIDTSCRFITMITAHPIQSNYIASASIHSDTTINLPSTSVSYILRTKSTTCRTPSIFALCWMTLASQVFVGVFTELEIQSLISVF